MGEYLMEILIVLLVLALCCFYIWDWYDCIGQGGEYVRGLLSMKCIGV